MKSKIFICCLIFILNMPQVLAASVELLTFDKSETKKDGLPRNFRELSEFGLNAIASGQFSEKELQAIRKKYPNEKIIIVDLRRESHGLINGRAVSWREQFDKSNANKKDSEILRDEKLRLNLLKKDQQILINQIVKKDKKNGWYEKVSPQIVDVKEVATEEELAKKNGFEYKRFAVQDHAAPDQKQFLELVKFIKSLPQDKKIYVHCAAGKGRTTSFLTLYDIIKNGDKVTLEEILERQHKAGGSRLDKINEDEKWRENLAQEKLEMIKKFYEENSKKS